MKFHKHTFIVLLLMIACLAPAVAVAIETGVPAPGFSLKNLQGEEVRLADFKGRLVLLKLATTWCPTCKELTAEIKSIGDFLKEQNVVLLDVFVQDSEKMIKKYLGKWQPPMTFHALIDDGQAHKGYSVYLIPRLLVIDAGQTVRFDSAGRNVLAKEITDMVLEFNVPATSGDAS